MAIYAILKEDHDNLRNLSTEIDTSKSKEEKEEKFSEFKVELLSHFKIEEKVFYKQLSQSISSVIKEGISEHHIIDMILEELEYINILSEDWNVKFKVLKENLKHHMQEEEEKLFIDARDYLRNEDAKRIGIDFIERKELARRAFG